MARVRVLNLLLMTDHRGVLMPGPPTPPTPTLGVGILVDRVTKLFPGASLPGAPLRRLGPKAAARGQLVAHPTCRHRHRRAHRGTLALPSGAHPRSPCPGTPPAPSSPRFFGGVLPILLDLITLVVAILALVRTF